MSDEHVCDATINPCTCGRVWDYVRTYSNGARVYTSSVVKERYLALYGQPRIPFVSTKEK